MMIHFKKIVFYVPECGIGKLKTLITLHSLGVVIV